MVQKNHMVYRFLSRAWIATFFFLYSCTGIEVERGSFQIQFDEKKISFKADFLENIPVADRADSIPNIVVIMVDDLGKNDISTYDPQGVPSPNIERLAKDGVKFINAYSTSSVCSPSRAGFITGRYQQRFGFERQPMNRYPNGKLEYLVVDRFINTDPMRLLNPMSSPPGQELQKQGIPPGEILLPEILRKRGYKTGIFGKWHLGYHDSFKPNNRGFDEQYGFYEAFSRYVPDSDDEIINFRHDYFANRHIWRQKRKGTCAIRENDKVIVDEQYLTFSIAERACSFIETNKDYPFFLYIPFSAPHTPFQVPLEYYNRFSHVEDKNKRVYYGMISALDDAVGQILDRLERTGLKGQTLVVFASDNGGATYTGATDNGILKAGKFSQFEGGINIPMILSWRGRIPNGNVNSQPVSLMDVFTTSIKVSGCEMPEDRSFDGIDLMPLLQPDYQDSIQRTLFWRTDFNKAVRHGAWKLVWNERDNQVFLYNLDSDPGEHSNIAGINGSVVDELKRKIRDWESEMMDPMWPGVMEFKFDLDGEITWWSI